MVEGNILKVSSISDPAKVGGAVANIMKEEYAKCGNRASVELRALGAQAVSQAVKSVIIARGFLATAGMNIYCIPAYIDDDVNGEKKSITKFTIRTEV